MNQNGYLLRLRFAVEYVDLQLGVGARRFLSRLFDALGAREQNGHAPVSLDLGLAENPDLRVRLRKHVLEVGEFHPVRVSFDHDGPRRRRTVKGDVGNRQSQHGAYVERELGQILRYHRHHTRIVRARGNFAENNPVVPDEQLDAEQSPATERLGNPAGDLLGLCANGRIHRLGGARPAGGGPPRRIDLEVVNTGSSELKDIQLSSRKPAGWELSFEPSKIASLKAGAAANVTAELKASPKALPGDYVVVMDAKTPEVTADAQFRISVKTPLFWGWVGVLVILAAVGGVYCLFRKYGRR